MPHADFRARYGDVPSKSELTLLCQRLDDPTKRIFVFFPEASKVCCGLVLACLFLWGVFSGFFKEF